MTEFLEICGRYKSNQRIIQKYIIRIDKIVCLHHTLDKGATIEFINEYSGFSKEPTLTLWLSEEEYERIKKILLKGDN